MTAGLFSLNKYVCKLTPKEVATGLFSLNKYVDKLLLLLLLLLLTMFLEVKNI